MCSFLCLFWQPYSAVFLLFYAIDGVLRERLFEILAVAVAVAVVLFYLIGNFIVNGDEHTPLRIVRDKMSFATYHTLSFSLLSPV